MKKYDVKKLREKLERCKNVSFDDITLDDVDDISTVKISKKQNEYEKILDFIENTKKTSESFGIRHEIVDINFYED